jgi:hypothetical protein
MLLESEVTFDFVVGTLPARRLDFVALETVSMS